MWRPYAVVRVRGEVVPREYWPRLRPKPGALVEVVVVPQGGGGWLRIVLTLAIVAAAAGVAIGTGGLGVPALGLAAGSVGAGILGATVGAAISVGGMMLVNALIPVEPPQLAKNSTKASPTYSIGGGSNSARFKEPVKQILGRHRVYLDLAAPWYTEQVGDDQYLRGLLDIGLAPLIVTDIKIGETPISEYQDVEYEILPGTSAGVESSALYPGDVVQDTAGTALTAANGEVVRTTRRETDEWNADLAFARGLTGYGKNTGDPLGASVDIDVRYRTAADGNVAAGGWSSPVTYPISAKNGTPIRRSIGDVFPARGYYDLGFTRTTPDHDPLATGSSGAPHVLDECSLESLRSLNTDAPVNLPGVVRLALRIRATKQLGGTINSLNCVATSIAPAWDPVAGAWVADAVNGTRSPSALMRLVLQGPGQPIPTPDARIALAELEDWSELCAAAGWTCDFVVDRDLSTMEVLKIVCGCGRASPMQPDGLWTVATDVPKATPVQHYTPRNMAAFRWKRIFAKQPHALRVTFVDATQGWRNDAERVVYQDGYDETTATEFLDWEMPGCTDPDLIHRHGRKRLAEMSLRPETYEIDAFWESLVNTRGDWIKIAHDTIESAFAFPRIASVVSSAGRATALIVDDAVVLDGTGPYGVFVRLADGTAWTAPVSAFAGESYRLDLETPVDLAAAGPVGGELATVGLRGTETEDVLVIGIRRGKDHTATITAVPLAPAVHTAEIGPIPPWNPVLATPAGTVAPLIWAISSDSSALHRDADGGYRLAMVVSFSRDATAPLDKYAAVEVLWTEEGTGAPPLSREWPADALEARLSEVRLGETYLVQARYRIRPELVKPGKDPYGPWGGAKEHYLYGPQLPPPDPGLPYLAGDRVVWSYPDPPPDFAGFAVRIATTAGQTWDAAQSLTDGLYPQSYVLLSEIPVSAAELLVRAEDATGNLSTGTARLGVLGLPRPKVVTISSVDYAALDFPGVVVGGEVVGGGGGSPPALSIASGPPDPSPVPSGPTAAAAVIAGSVAGAVDAVASWTITGLASSDMADGLLAGTVTVLAGARSGVLSLAFAAQTLAVDKAAILAIAAVSGCTLGSPSSVGFVLRKTIAGSLPAASITVGVADVLPAGAASFTVGLSAAATAPATVAWRLTGLASGDMADGLLTGSAVVPAGSSTVVVDLAFATQTLLADKAATVTIAVVSGCTLGTPSSDGFTLQHNTVASPPSASIAFGPGTVLPDAAVVVHNISRIVLSGPAPAAATVGWSIAGLVAGDLVGGALSGSFIITTGNSSFDLDLAFAAQSLATAKNATLSITATSGCTLGSPSSAPFTLSANTAPPGWPYPQSTYITAITLDWGKFDLLASGSDNWVSTWAQDDKAYVTYGDGGGFGGLRVSIGLASITGTVAGALGGANLVGGGNGTVARCFPVPAGSGYPTDTNKGGPCVGTGLNAKSYGPLALGANLYQWMAPGHVPGSYAQATLFKSTLAKLGTWTAASWGFTNSTGWIGTQPTFLQAGKDYGDAFDGFVYAVVNGWNPVAAQPATTEFQPGDIFLMRCPITADPMAQANWSWFTGTAASPSWGAYAGRKAAWHDAGKTGWACSMFYSKPLDRCILMVTWGAWDSGQLGVYEAPRPWGPWGTVDRFLVADGHSPARFDPSIFIASALTRGLSTDGKSFPLLMSGSLTADALVAVQATLTVGGAPAAVASLASGFGSVTPSPGAPVTATATVGVVPAPASAASVTWTITGLVAGDLVGGALTGTLPIAAGATSATLTVTLAAQTLAADKAATLTLSAPSGCTLGSPASAGFTLLHNTVVVGAKYVSTTGSDSTGTGTLANPWRTIAHGLAGRAPGDTVVVRGGSYREAPLTIGVSGAAGSPITVQVAAGEVATLDACFSVYQTAPNTAWQLAPGGAATNTYQSVATGISAGSKPTITLVLGGRYYALNRYASLAWLMSTNYTYSTNPSNYYRGPGFFFDGNRIFIRLEPLTGARAVDLDTGNSAIPPGFDFNIPPDPDPRNNVLLATNVSDSLTVNGDHIVWDGISIQGGDRNIAGSGSFLTVKCPAMLGARVAINTSGNGHDWLITQIRQLNVGFFSPWASWAEIKTSKEATDQKRSVWTLSGTNYNLELSQCLIGPCFDGFTANGHGLKLNNCEIEYVLDDMMQHDTNSYDVQFCRNICFGPGLTYNGSTPQTVNLNSKYYIGNIVYNVRDQAGLLPEFYCRTSHPSAASHVTWRHSHIMFPGHTDPSNAGVSPLKVAQNTFVYKVTDNHSGVGFQRVQRGAGLHEVYNNISLALDTTRGCEDGDTRGGQEIRDGNVYWQATRTGREALFINLMSSASPGGATYASLVAFRAATTVIAETQGYYPPGWEAKSIEADPLLVDYAGGDYRLQSTSPARTGFVDLSGKGWQFLELGTHAGAVAPGGTDPKGVCGATFFR